MTALRALWVWALWSLCLIPAAGTAEVRVFAAASLKTALDAVVVQYQAAGGGSVVVSYAGSSALARQIQHGAPADLFLSANRTWADALEGRTAEREPLVSNRLVLIGGAGAAPENDPVALAPDLVARLEGGRLAMALTQAVPAGIYGRQALESLGLWQDLSPHVAQFPNVRATLQAVATGAAPLGIVYATDAGAAPRVRALAEFPEDSHDPILYPAVLLRDAGAEAHDFWTYLTGPARSVFYDHGFLPAGGAQ